MPTAGLRAVTLLVLLSFSPYAALGKPSQSASSSKTPPLSIPKARKFDHNETITVAYDKFENYTSATMDPMMPLTVLSADHDLRELDFSAFYFCLGEKLHAPDKVTLQFVAHSSEPWYRDHVRGLVLLVDGKRLTLGNTEWRRGDIVTGIAYESLAVAVSLKDFITTVNAKRVEGQLGGTEFALSRENLEALRDLASRMNETESANPIVAAASPSQPQPPKIETSYDKFRNTTSVTLRMEVSPDAELTLLHMCMGSAESCPSIDPASQSPGLFISGRTSEVPDVTSVYPLLFLVDGVRVNLGNMGCKFNQFVGARVEWLCYMAPNVDDVLKVSHAKTAQAQIGPWQFQLTEEQLAAMRDFAQRLGYEASQADAPGPKPNASIATQSQPPATLAPSASPISSASSRQQGAQLIEDSFRKDG
jgi:hypothetical protein